MAAKKKKSSVKHKKTTVKKHRGHKVIEKKALVEEPQKQEVQEGVSSEPQAPVESSEPKSPTESTNALGSPVVASSGSLPESPKEQESQAEPKSPDSSQLESQWGTSQPSQTQSLQQPSGQNTDTQTPQPESSSVNPPNEEVSSKTVETEGKITQDPLATSGVVRDKVEIGTGGESIDEPKKNRLWIIITIIVIILVLVGGALWYFRENFLKIIPAGDEITPTPSIIKNTPTPATDSAKMEIDLSEYSINVLNGSGISGVAGETKEILESEDFSVEEIGNADRSDYEGTVIKAKGHVPSEFLERLKEVLEETYILDSTEDLEDSQEVDVIVIVGSDKQP